MLASAGRAAWACGELFVIQAGGNNGAAMVAELINRRKRIE
jgi:hypothetical protein